MAYKFHIRLQSPSYPHVRIHYFFAGHSPAQAADNDGDDSDATIVEKDKGSDDGDTEVCDEETGVNGHFNNTDYDDDSEDEDDDDKDYKPTSKFRQNSTKTTVKGEVMFYMGENGFL